MKMKKDLRSLIEKLNMSLTRQNGEWAVAVASRPSNQEIAIIKSRKQELIAELKEMQKERFAKENEEKENQKIVVEYQEGEILQGYKVKQNKEKAEELGIAKMVSNWGYLVKKEIIEALGTEFTVNEARAYLESLKTKKEVTKEEKLRSLIETAKVLGHRVEIESYPVACDGSVEECDTDIITKYVDASGNITISRMHTH
jgi:hypothetical protein